MRAPVIAEDLAGIRSRWSKPNRAIADDLSAPGRSQTGRVEQRAVGRRVASSTVTADFVTSGPAITSSSIAGNCGNRCHPSHDRVGNRRIRSGAESWGSGSHAMCSTRDAASGSREAGQIGEPHPTAQLHEHAGPLGSRGATANWEWVPEACRRRPARCRERQSHQLRSARETRPAATSRTRPMRTTNPRRAMPNTRVIDRDGQHAIPNRRDLQRHLLAPCLVFCQLSGQ